jgi:RHS repeat-associated protein
LGKRASGTYTVTLQDAIGRQSSVGFGVIHDTTPSTLTLQAVVQGSNVHVTWSSDDSGSGVDTSTCLLEVREDEGAWQTFSTQCRGEDATHDGQPVHTYTFRLSARDNVSNAASTEVEAVVPYVKKYYYANGQRVAMQKEGVVYYVHTDHLGSTSLTTCGSQDGCDGTPYQGVVARQLYHPYGSPRWSQGTLPTDYTFTGQRLEAGLGLMHYGARFYSPRLGRFISSDTIIPVATRTNDGVEDTFSLVSLTVGFYELQFISQVGEKNRDIAQSGFQLQRSEEKQAQPNKIGELANPQALNRFSYCSGNPLKYTDPSGHQGLVEIVAVVTLIVIVFEFVVVPFGLMISKIIEDSEHPESEDEELPPEFPGFEPDDLMITTMSEEKEEEKTEAEKWLEMHETIHHWGSGNPHVEQEEHYVPIHNILEEPVPPWLEYVPVY